MRTRLQTLATAALVLCVVPGSAAGADARQSPSGEELYRTACAACHGPDGRGNPQHIVGFDIELPDFTDCAFATPEADADWLAVIHHGGPARAFDRKMPSFGEALSDAEMTRIVAHLRTFCRSPQWPRGELNLPRPLVTEKAFPENEAVVTTTIDGGTAASVGNQFLYERRLGARSQFEVSVPFDLQEGDEGGWHRGLGDVAAAVKRVLFASLPRGTIVSAAGELSLPTGKEDAGLGSGVTRFEPYIAVGQILPSDGFLHGQAGIELSSNTERSPHEAFWRVAAGKTFFQGPYGRGFSPMLELVAARELEEGAGIEWDVVPQMQVTLSRRQHVMVSGGLQIPVSEREGRSTRVIVYLLWDWFDGSFFSGWH